MCSLYKSTLRVWISSVGPLLKEGHTRDSEGTMMCCSLGQIRLQIQEQYFNYVNRFTMAFSPTLVIYNKIKFILQHHLLIISSCYFQTPLIPPATATVSTLRSLFASTNHNKFSSRWLDLSVIGTIYPLTL